MREGKGMALCPSQWWIDAGEGMSWKAEGGGEKAIAVAEGRRHRMTAYLQQTRFARQKEVEERVPA